MRIKCGTIVIVRLLEPYHTMRFRRMVPTGHKHKGEIDSKNPKKNKKYILQMLTYTLGPTQLQKGFGHCFSFQHQTKKNGFNKNNIILSLVSISPIPDDDHCHRDMP